MLKQIVIGILGVTVVGAAGSALVYQSMQTTGQAAASEGQAVFPTLPPTGQPAAQAQVGTQEPQSDVGEPWTMTGSISVLDDFGMTLVGVDGTSTYVELGPPDYWQTQGVTLTPGDTVMVNGYANEGQYHAGVVMTSGGQQLTIRDAYGRPMWSGGVQNANGLSDGSGTPQPRAQVDEWITVHGTISAVARNMITVQTDSGELLSIQMGRPDFAASQGITFNIGDEVSIVGFWEGTQFNAGDITQVATGLRLMLRDPNGRPLWAGPGNGNGNGGGQGQTAP